MPTVPVSPQPQSEESPYMRPQHPVVNNTNGLPARPANKPVMTLENIENTEISEITYDDVAGLDEIFNN